MKLFLLYISVMCVTWLGDYFREKKAIVHSVKEVREMKEAVPFELVPANLFIQYNQ